MQLVAVDVETTGLSPRRDRVVEFAVLELDQDLTVGSSWVQRVNPQRKIPWSARRIHGISNEDVQHRPSFSEYAKTVQDVLQDAVIVGYNARFDVSFLHHELTRHNHAGISETRVIDPLRISQQHFNKTCKLHEAVQHFCNTELVDAHAAEADIRATVDVLRAQLSQLDASVENVVQPLTL